MRGHIVLALAVNNFIPGAGFTPPNKMSKMNVVNAHLASNARRTSTFPWGDLLGQRFAELNVACGHIPATFSASYVGVCVARRAHCELRTVLQSTRYRGNMIYRHFRDVWLTTTPRGVVYGAFRRPRGVS